MTERARAKVREHLNVEEDQHSLFQKWAGDSSTKEGRLFPSMTAMFVFAASLGQAANAARSIKGRKVDTFRWLQLSEQSDVPVLEAIAVAHTGDISVLGDRNRILDIIEECATGGVDLMRLKLIGSRTRNLESLAKLTLEYSSSPQTAKPRPARPRQDPPPGA